MQLLILCGENRAISTFLYFWMPLPGSPSRFPTRISSSRFLDGSCTHSTINFRVGYTSTPIQDFVLKDRLGFLHLCVPSAQNRARHTVSNQSILKEINPEYSLEGLMLRL